MMKMGELIPRLNIRQQRIAAHSKAVSRSPPSIILHSKLFVFYPPHLYFYSNHTIRIIQQQQKAQAIQQQQVVAASSKNSQGKNKKKR
jgi:hypothetical protein